MNESTLSHFDLLEALQSCQLQIEQGTGQPSKGGYLSSFDTVYKVTMTSKIFPIHSNDPNNIIIDAHHFPDDKIFLQTCMQRKNQEVIHLQRKIELTQWITTLQS